MGCASGVGRRKEEVIKEFNPVYNRKISKGSSLAEKLAYCKKKGISLAELNGRLK